jgi:hypothetical protein
MGEPMVTILRVSAGIIVAIFVVSLGSMVYLDYHYMYTRPENPQIDTGRTYPLNIHGTVVYLDKHENFIMESLFIVLEVCFIVLAVVVLWYRSIGKENRLAR